jgi:ABC-type glycerol-3-phosphate transport system substrate-binding protein
MRVSLTRFLVTALLVTMVLSATVTAKTTVTFLVWGDTVRWQPILADFAAKHPGTVVEMQSHGGNAFALQEALFVRSAAGTPPDLALTHLLTHGENVECGLFADLSSFIKQDRVDLYRFFPKGGVDAFTGDGRVTGIPYQLSTHLLWYNKSLFDLSGIGYPDRSWRMTEELVTQGRKLTRDIDGDGVVDQWGLNCVNIHRIAPLFWGAMMWTPDLRHSNMLDPRVRKAYDWMYDVFNTWQISSAQISGPGTFAGGKVAMLGTIQNVFRSLNNMTDDWDVELWPIAPAGAITYGSGAGISMVTGAAHPEAAWSFLKYWMTPSVQEMAMSRGLSPAGLGALRDYFLKFDARAQNLNFSPDSFQNRRAILESFERTVVQPSPPSYSDVDKLQTDHLMRIARGESSPQVVLETMHPQLEAILQQAWSRN